MIELTREPSWVPMIKVLLSVYGAEWVHMEGQEPFGARHDCLEQYRHAVTGRDLYVSPSGNCYLLEDGDFVEVEPASALEMARAGAEQMDEASEANYG